MKRIATLLLACSCGASADAELVDGGSAGADADVLTDASPPQASGPARYRADETRSPITSTVVDSLRTIHSASASPNDGVFMKVGASGTVSNNFLDCFAGDAVDLDGRSVLQSSIDYWKAPMAAGVSSWSRTTLAAEVGRTASWAIGGDPSPLEQEIAAIGPRIALVNYGTNDMQLGITHETALWPFLDNFSRLLDQLEEQGIIPIITGLNPRADNAIAAEWVPTYNTATRAIAEARQLPYINLFLASVGLENQGLIGDGLHGNAFSGGACVFTGEGLGFNYNARNLLTLEVLDEVKRVAIDMEDALAEPTPGYQGTGTASDPIIIDSLPFTHSGNTALDGQTAIDDYPGCGATQNESGPEIYYRLELDDATPVRILLFNRDDVDVDIHLLGDDGQANSCIDRDHRILERTLVTGAYILSVDSFVNSAGTALSGAYSLAVLACAASDTRCQ